MNVFIIGSEGFIGRHLVNFFAQKGWDIFGCDLVDYPSSSYNYLKLSRLNPSFDDAFKNKQYDVCINASGNGSVPISIKHPLTDFEANCTDVIRLMELIRLKNATCKYVHISSAAVYGNPAKLPIAENDELKPLSPYGWHKLISEHICKEYSQLYQIPVVILRPFSIYGPGLRKQLFWDVFEKVESAKSLNSHKILLYGTGEESRDFIFITDVCNAIYRIIEHTSFGGEAINLASGNEITIATVVRQFIQLLDDKIDVEFGGEKKEGDPLNWRSNVTLLSQLGFECTVSINDGLNKLVKWLKEKK